MASAQSFHLTEHLLSRSASEYQAATQAPFLVAAAEGRLSKETLGEWLANDRLYIHAYIRAVGTLLASIDLPQTVPSVEAPETQLVDWLIEALAAVRKEERFFIEVAERYGLGMNLEAKTISQGGFEVAKVQEESKIPGLPMIESVFASIPARAAPDSGFSIAALGGAPTPIQIPWLEGAIVLWGTERVYLDAWSFAKSKQPNFGQRAVTEDADGGALRKEFIPNWSSLEFSNFVARLGGIIDYSVAVVVERVGEKAKDDILKRVEEKWKSLLAAEAAFWPHVE
ncbi:heme oxygenase-like protein [Thozetella sp. PMI_491]|nr:heme oxygenase-like protein [Thozetella sp. PMI_491]